MATIDIKRVLAYYIQVVVRGDLKKLTNISVESELIEKAKSAPKPPSPTPPIKSPSAPHSVTVSSVITTTLPPPGPENFFQFDPEVARCTIPMAMTLISSIELLGAILKNPYEFNFEKSIENFFVYAGVPFSAIENKMLRSAFRNGMMHGFFPQGEEVAISYDSALNDSQIFVVNNDNVILNVKALSVIFSNTAYKMFNDFSIHSTMQISFDQWYSRNKGSAGNEIQLFKSNWV
jgi:hypothetical protein